MAESQHRITQFFRNKDGEIVIAQKPNAPILLWVAAVVANWLISNQAVSHLLSIISSTALAIWAILEIGWGVSYFRRLLGVVVFAWITFSLLS